MILKFRNSGLKVLAAIVAVMGLWLVSTISSSAKNNAVTWDWQLSGTPDLTRKVDVLNLDPGDVNKKDMAALPVFFSGLYQCQKIVINRA